VAKLMKLLGIPASNTLFKSWSEILVYPVSPCFLTDEMKAQISSICLTRNEFRETIQDLSFHDAYTTYRAASEINWVTLLSTAELNNLPEDTRLELLKLQVHLGRGQIYSFDNHKNLLKADEFEKALESTFKFEGKRMLELNHTLWHSFSFETQKHWLGKFISEDRSDCLSGTLGKNQWRHINKKHPAIKHLLGFAEKSGANCFATTLAVMLEVEQAKSVSSLWLQTESFLRTLQEHGYRRSSLEPNEHLPEGSILIWENDQGLQHACFYLGEGLVFNKDAQGWFAPRQILSLESVLKNWQEFRVCVYAR
jgi:hypothetical protein